QVEISASSASVGARLLCGITSPSASIEAICDHLLPLADVATPNINELRDLSADGSIEAARKMGARSVVVTSAIQETEKIGAWVVTPDGCDEIKHPRIAEPARGTGDFFSAVLASALLDDPANVTAAARTAAAATYGVVAGSGSVALDLPANQAAIVSPDLSLVIGG
ncbi:MAG: PfkB family carbohydrate kinase, partial [Pseudomonadota bacterium]